MSSTIITHKQSKHCSLFIHDIFNNSLNFSRKYPDHLDRTQYCEVWVLLLIIKQCSPVSVIMKNNFESAVSLIVGFVSEHSPFTSPYLTLYLFDWSGNCFNWLHHQSNISCSRVTLVLLMNCWISILLTVHLFLK